MSAWDDAIIARGGPQSAPRRLRRIRLALEAGDPLRAEDAAWLAEALREDGEAARVLTRRKKGRPKHRTARECAPAVALATEVLKRREAGDSHAEAVAHVVATHNASTSKVNRAYRDHREMAQMQIDLVRATQAPGKAIAQWAAKLALVSKNL